MFQVFEVFKNSLDYFSILIAKVFGNQLIKHITKAIFGLVYTIKNIINPVIF